VEQRQLLVEAYLVNLQAEERIYRDMVSRKAEGEITTVDQAEQKAVLLMARANYLESINQLRIAVAALEAALAAPAGDLLTLHDIYQTQLSMIEQSAQMQKPVVAASTPHTAAAAVIPSTNQLSASVGGKPVIKEDGHDYVLQLGAFKSEERARAFINSLESQYPEMKFETVAAKGFHKVRSKALQSHVEAVSTLESFNGKGFIVRANTSH
jgi:hypothetical protein